MTRQAVGCWFVLSSRKVNSMISQISLQIKVNIMDFNFCYNILRVVVVFTEPNTYSSSVQLILDSKSFNSPEINTRVFSQLLIIIYLFILPILMLTSNNCFAAAIASQPFNYSYIV